jgi:pimeloyl-ACP methyl ester carboxylesterase
MPRFIELPEPTRRLEYVEIPGESPALVFLHEGLGSVALWRDFPARVAEATGRRAVVYSRLGHGDSDPAPLPRTPRFMHDEALRTLPALLDRLHIDDPVLIGHSDGASIALIHAGCAGRPPTGLVAIAPHVFVEDVSVASIAEARRAFEQTDLRERMARYHRDPDATFRGWNDIWLEPAFRDWNIEDVLPGIACPVLVIQGARDQYGTLAQVDAIEGGVTGRVDRVVLDDARHAPHLEAPEETFAAVVEFLRRS